MYLKFFKRLLDVCFALPAVIILAPLFLLIAIVIKITSRGTTLYKQTRVGKNCHPFLLYKFRTMKPFSDQEGISTQRNDPRITGVGRFLRLMSIDELPQFANIIKGDMSFIGPRPATLIQAPTYSEEDWVKRHHVRPGITGLAQVNGRSKSDFDRRLMYDLQYVDSVSFKMDMIILFKTVFVVFNPRNAN